MKRLILLAMVGIAIMLWGSVAMAQAAGCIHIGWDPYQGNIIGFKIYTGTASGVYGTPTTINVPSATEFIVTNLIVGTNYYIAITAYDASRESDYSNQVVGPATLCAPANLKRIGR